MGGADRELSHLYPEFRRRLAATLAEAERVTGLEWIVVEGFRSQARQSALYAQGRTAPGPIVTWKKSPTWHGVGLAADVAPLKGGAIWWSAPLSAWQSLREAGLGHGLSNPAWSKGDRGHLQLTDYVVREKARRWVAAGFRE